MLVDDDQHERTTLRRYLERRGWLVIEAGSAEVAVQLLVRDVMRVDVVVVDMHVGGITGSELCGRLAALRPALAKRLILTSGDGPSAVEEMVRATLPCPVLPKPFELDDLDRLLDDVVAAA
jgi:two-component system cell cycle sensor histidine kinase/response regulator CckA